MRLRIVVVDDNSHTAAGFAALLSSWGHDVRTADGGWEAVQCAREFGPDVVLLDIGKPDVCGYEAARRLRSECPENKLRLIAVTEHPQREHKVRAYEAGCDAHLVKPIEEDAFKAMLARFQRMAAARAQIE